MAAAERSPGNPGGPKPPQRRNEVYASTRAKVQELKESLEQIQNLLLGQVKWQEITQQNIANFQGDISHILQEILTLEKMPYANVFFYGIDKFKSLLLTILKLLATQHALFDLPRKNKKAILDFFSSYQELLQLISEAIMQIKLA